MSVVRSSRLPAAAVLLVAGGLLSGCAGVPGFSEVCQPVASGDASELISAEGDLGSEPEVDFPTPLVAKSVERTVIEQGDGDELRSGGVADIEYSILNGATGEVLGTSDYAEGPGARFTVDQTGQALGEALRCARPGSRLAIAAHAADVYGEGGLIQAGIDDDATLVFVVDVERTWLGKADGANQLPVDGMPTVVTAVDGTPGVVVPAEPAPTEARSSVIKAGDGAVVQEDDDIVLHYSSFSWPADRGEKPLAQDSSWGQAPVTYTVSNDAELGEEVAEALIGARVGSQLLVVAPREDERANIFVLDILGIESDD